MTNVEEILSKTRSVLGKSFEERIKRFEEIHEPNNNYGEIINDYANKIMGSDQNSDKLGARQAALNHLRTIKTTNDGVVENEEDITAVLETYVDTFLNHIHPKYDSIVKKINETGVSKEDIREWKGKKLTEYQLNPKSRIANLLEGEKAKELKGKKISEIEKEIEDISKEGIQNHLIYLDYKLKDGLIDPHADIISFPGYVEKKFRENGLCLPKGQSFLTKDYQHLRHDYTLLLQKDKELIERGYKKIEPEKKEE